MPILPLVDLFILMGTGSLAVGFVLKAVAISTHYRPTLLGFSSLDFVLIAAICMVFALTLVARTWLKLHEPRLLDLQRLAGEDEARRRARALQFETPEAPLGGDGGALDGSISAGTASVEQR